MTRMTTALVVVALTAAVAAQTPDSRRIASGMALSS